MDLSLKLPPSAPSDRASPVLDRRGFIKGMAVGAAVSALPSALRVQAQAPTAASRFALGMDTNSVRGMLWNDQQVIDYAAAQEIDAVLLNIMQKFDSLDSAYLRKLKDELAARQLRIYFGVGSISEGSTMFSNEYGSAEELLTLGVRVAADVGSSVVNCRIGNAESPAGTDSKIWEQERERAERSSNGVSRFCAATVRSGKKFSLIFIRSMH